MGSWINRGILRLHRSRNKLHEAVRNRDLERVRKLLDSEAELVNALDGEGNGPLHAAAGIGSQRSTDVEEILISYGAEVNARNRAGSTPLHIAAMNGRGDLTALLLSKGAEVNATDRSWTPLHFGAYHGHRDVCNLLISKGAVVNWPDQYWETPLHLAIYGCHRDVIELLIEKGADVNWSCEDGRFIGRHLTPLLLAVRAEREDIAQSLILKGADVNTGNRYCVTPLHEAAGRGLISTIALLIEHGSNLHAITSPNLYEVGGLASRECGGATPVKLAILANRTEAVQLRRRHGGT